MSQQLTPLEDVLAKLQARSQLSFAEKRILARGLKRLTGYVDDYVTINEKRKRIRKKVYFFTNPSFASRKAETTFDCRHLGDELLEQRGNKVWLVLAFNYARYRLSSARSNSRKASISERPGLFAECAEWIRAAIKLQARLSECYDEYANKQAKRYAYEYSGRGMTAADLLGSARDGIVAGLNTFDVGRIPCDLGDDNASNDNAIRGHLSYRVKTAVVNSQIKKELRRTRPIVSPPSQEEDEDEHFIESFAAQSEARPPAWLIDALPSWLIEVLEQRKNSPRVVCSRDCVEAPIGSLEDALSRLLICRSALDRRQPESRLHKSPTSQKHMRGQTKTIQGTSVWLGKELHLGDIKMIPPDWRVAWTRTIIQLRLLQQRT